MVSAGSRTKTSFFYSPTDDAGIHDWLAIVRIAADNDTSNNIAVNWQPIFLPKSIDKK
jgi:hypothetical protein